MAPVFSGKWLMMPSTKEDVEDGGKVEVWTVPLGVWEMRMDGWRGG